ncbi:hypothetical protein [Peribacillus saganii]|uniref:hypothetical protein n=1 Tax=Peribacillus saganii TaxID=2303992 RepID=UPI0013143237|nr:hypothetical protein [Peribacillus saganii]
MTIGLSKTEIIAKLNENEDIVSDELFEKIAEIIVENNKKIEKEITKVVSGDLLKKIRR